MSELLRNYGVLSLTGHVSIALSDDEVNKEEYFDRLSNQNRILNAIASYPYFLRTAKGFCIQLS